MPRLAALVVVVALADGACGGHPPAAPSASVDPAPTPTPTPPTPGPPRLVSITVVCDPGSDGFRQCRATGHFSDGTTASVTTQATWTSSDPTVALIDERGRLAPLITGTTEIRATVDTITGVLLFHSDVLFPAVALSLECIAGTAAHRCVATATFSNGVRSLSTAVNATSTWTSSNPAVATVDGEGQVTHLARGTTEIRATYKNLTASRTLDIDPSVVVAGDFMVINEISPRRGDDPTEEFIELRNDGAVAVSLRGWRVMRSTAAGVVSEVLRFAPDVIVRPGCHFLLSGRTTYLNADVRYSADVDDDGGVALVRADGSIADQVGMSSGSAYREGTPLAPFPINLTRQPPINEFVLIGYARTHADTNNNAADFTLADAIPNGSNISCHNR
jgi:hypothetical protein